MELIKKLTKLSEDAAGGSVGAGAVAGFAMPLFVALTKQQHPIKIRYTKKKKEKKVREGMGIREAFTQLSEFDDAHQTGQDSFDTTEVIAKLKSLENKDAVDKNETQSFVLEDDDGNMVKIWVRADQAAAFEATLNAVLAHEDEDEQRGVPEIAEILFKLKDRFDIVDVEFPEVQEDEEQEVALAGQQPGAEGAAPAPGAEGDLGISPEDLTPGAEAGGGEGEVKGLLTQVIDMMKADAEARKAEANARAAEARARESEVATQQVVAKVKREEQILDMEADEKKQKEADKEAKRLAKLARWQHDMEQGGSGEEPVVPTVPEGRPGREEEEMQHPVAAHAQQPKKGSTIRGRVSPAEVAGYILGRMK